MKHSIMILLVFCSVSGTTQLADVKTSSTKEDFKAKHRVLAAPPESLSLVRKTTLEGRFKEAVSIGRKVLQAHPNDVNLRRLIAEVAFLQDDYATVEEMFTMSASFRQEYPELLISLEIGSAAYMRAFVASYGIKPSESAERLWAVVHEDALSRKSNLPFEIIDIDGEFQTDGKVIALALLADGFGTHRPIIIDKMVKLAPKDTFVLEMQAENQRRHGKVKEQIATLRRSAAAASKTRKKHLEGVIKQAEAEAKRLGIPTKSE